MTVNSEKNHHLVVPEEENNPGHPMAIDSTAESADAVLPAFLARPSGTPVYHGFQVLEDVVVDGFTLGLITALEEGGATEGDAFVIGPDDSRAGLVWEFSNKQEIGEICPMSKERWGVWAVSFPFPMRNREDARQNLRAILPILKPKWEEWRQAYGQNLRGAKPKAQGK